ncbi:MAG: HAD-IA family hydrolase [Thermoleophilia bacterium]|nr:HAD-IA family hydrolase [Thermoleophilia bacterium]
MRYDPVLFDLDGTLVDSGAMILASFRHATKTVLAREIPDEQLLAFVGGMRLTEQMERIAPERAAELVRIYREHNEPLHRELQAFEGMLETLATLRGQGRRLGIVTAKRRATVELAFAAVPIERYFDVVVGADDTERHKPHPDPLLRALALLGARADAAAYVGDSPYDVRAAKAAGLAAVAVAWGGIHPAERLAEEEPDALVHSAEELLAVL